MNRRELERLAREELRTWAIVLVVCAVFISF